MSGGAVERDPLDRSGGRLLIFPCPKDSKLDRDPIDGIRFADIHLIAEPEFSAQRELRRCHHDRCPLLS